MQNNESCINPTTVQTNVKSDESLALPSQTSNQIQNPSLVTDTSSSSIIVTTQVKFRTDLIGRDNSQYNYSSQNNNANNFNNKYNNENITNATHNNDLNLIIVDDPINSGIFHLPTSPIFTKSSNNTRFNHFGFRSRSYNHFKRKISSSKWNNSTINDTASSLSTLSAPVRFNDSSSVATTISATSSNNKYYDKENEIEINENILLDSISVENIPKINLRSDPLLFNMAADINGNNVKGNKEIFESTLSQGKHSPNSIQDDNQSSTNQNKSDMNTIAACKGIVNLTIICQFSRITVLLKEAQNLRCQNYLQYATQTLSQKTTSSTQNIQACCSAICNPFVKIQLVTSQPIPLPTSDPSQTPILSNIIDLFETEVFVNTSCPLFDKSFSFNISQLDYHKRILISIFHAQEKDMELLGSMSFGIKKFITKTQVSGWYYLLRQEIGQRKHLRAGNLSVTRIRSNSTSANCALQSVPSSCSMMHLNGSGSSQALANECTAQSNMVHTNGTSSVSSTKHSLFNNLAPFLPAHFNQHNVNHHSTIPSSQTCASLPNMGGNEALSATASHSFEVKLSKSNPQKGFGFTLCGGSPVYVSHVDDDSPAETGGIHPGDMVMRIDNFNVSQSSTETVVRMFRMCPKTVKVTILRTPNPLNNPAIPIITPQQSYNSTATSPLNISTTTTTASSPTPNMPFPPTQFYNHHSHTAPMQSILHNSINTTTTTTTISSPHSFLPPAPYSVVPPVPVTSPINSNNAHNNDNNDTHTTLSEPACHNMMASRNYNGHGGVAGGYPRSTKLESKSVHFLQEIINGNNQGASESHTSSKNNLSQNYHKNSSHHRSRAPSEGRLHRNHHHHSTRHHDNNNNIRYNDCPNQNTSSVHSNHNNGYLGNPPNPNNNNQHPPPANITQRFQYQGHLKKVNFNQYSNKLEVCGKLNLKEGNVLFPVSIYLFSEVILIGQEELDGHITIIKEPIYCSKICYVNIPALKKDELILQYINEVNRKQFVHFQSNNIREWLRHIQRHMIYHCNWWMTNVA